MYPRDDGDEHDWLLRGRREEGVVKILVEVKTIIGTRNQAQPPSKLTRLTEYFLRIKEELGNKGFPWLIGWVEGSSTVIDRSEFSFI